jgi:acetyl-CoA carboxylase carboxyl transferase subunit beta
MAWFSKKQTVRAPTERRMRTDGLWVKCDGCGEIALRQEVARNLEVCPHCDYHFALEARRRLELVLDAGSFEEKDRALKPLDPLDFKDVKRYRDRLKAAQKQTAAEDAFVGGPGRIGGRAVEVGAFVYEFMGGSMGAVVGEKVARMFERARAASAPVVLFSASGGARMQEGIHSLMQMGKTAAAIHAFRAGKRPFVSVMLNPTTGGVAASFAWLGDVILAEPKALIGFAGPRVIEQTIRQKLPEGFQRSEFLLEHGMIDAVVHRRDLREKLAQVLGLLG